MWFPIAPDDALTERIPPFSLCKRTGVNEDGNITVGKPDADVDYEIIVSGESVIDPEIVGVIGKGTYNRIVTVRYDSGDGEPADGEEWGPLTGGWFLRKVGKGFRIIGGSGQGVVTCLRLIPVIPDALTVDVVDGIPSYPDTTTLQFDETDGYSLSQPSPGVVRVDHLPATASQAGIVSTTTQTLGGNKTFANNVTVVGNITLPDSVHGDITLSRFVSGGLSLGLSGVPGRLLLSRLDVDNIYLTSSVTVNGFAGATGTDGAGSVFEGGICRTVGSGGGNIDGGTF